MKTLYEITVKRGQSFYVIAESPNEAQSEVKRLLDKADWWFSGDREVKNIRVIAKEYHCFPADRPSFSDDENLIIVHPESQNANKY
jgi:hypothetical protein